MVRQRRGEPEFEVNYHTYHPYLGQQALTITDINTASLDSDITGTGSGKWAAWSGAAPLSRGSSLPTGLELKTKNEFDDQGRLVKTIDPGGSEHYTRYEANKTLRFSYWTGGTSGSAELPVQVSETDAGGQLTEQYAVRPSKSQWDSASGLPELASYTTADYVSRTVYDYEATIGRQLHVDRYYDADASSGGYHRTSYLYDDLGRRGATIQEVAASKYQVTAQLFDVRNRVVETRQGVATAAPTAYGDLDNDPPGTPTNFDGYATVSETVFDSGGVGDGLATSTKRYYGTGASDYIEALPQYTFRGHSRGVLQKNGSTAFGPYQVQDIDWMGRRTASASYASEPTTWPSDYSDYVIHSSGTSADEPNTAGHHNVSVTKYDDLGRVYQTLRYPGSEATKRFQSNTYYDRRNNAVASEQVNGASTETAFDGAGRQYQRRTVTTLSSTTYSSGAFNYRAPQPDPAYGTGNEGEMSGGDDQVITLSHTLLDDGGNATESHLLESLHDDTDGIDLSGDDDYVRSSSYSWHDDADRLEVSATHGTGDGSGTGAGSWQYTALPTSITKPTTSSDAELVTLYGYHADSGRQDLVTDPAGIKTKTFYDDLGRQTFVATNYVNFDPSSIGSTVGGGTNDDEDQVVGYTFDGLGNNTALTAYNASASTADQVTEYQREDNYSASLVTMEIYPDGDATSDNIQMTYHLDGNLDTRTDQRGVVLTYSYDDARRTTLQAATTLPSGVDNTVQAIGRAYDTLGRVETITSYAGTTTGSTVRNQVKHTYGTHGQITKSEQDHSGAVSGGEPSVQYGYDESATSDVYDDGLRKESMTYPDGRVVFYGYDNATQGTIADRLGRIDEIRQTDGTGQQLASYDYFGGGRVAVTEYPEPDIHQHADRDDDGVHEVWDRFGRTLQASWRPTTGTGSNYLDRVDYTYDYASNRTSRNVRVDEIAGATLDERDQSYTYDGLHRLSDADEGTASNTTGLVTTQKFEQQWKLDQLGNWEEFDQDDDGDGVWDLEQSRTHNDVNEITAADLQTSGAGSDWADPAHDAAGNMTTIPQPASPTSSYSATWDAWNRLVSLVDDATSNKVQENEYDGRKFRIVRKDYSAGTLNETRHFYYTEGWQAIEERLGTSTNADRQFVWGPRYIDDLVLRDRDTTANGTLDERLYALQDGNWNVTAVADTSGAVQERYAYTPYGEPEYMDASYASRGSSSYGWGYLYTSRYLDSVSGLYYYRNRMYHAGLGRFCSRDPIGYKGSQWNLYEYVGSNPLKKVDPNGLGWLECTRATIQLSAATGACVGTVAGAIGTCLAPELLSKAACVAIFLGAPAVGYGAAAAIDNFVNECL